LFLTCIQFFALVRLSRDFTDDFSSCLLQLRATENRLHRWGKAAGIVDERSETFVKQLQNKYALADITVAHNACKQIAKRLSRAKEDSYDMMDMNYSAHEELEMETVDEMQRMEICGPEASRASRALESVRSGYERNLRFTSRAAVRGKWTVYRKKDLTDLLAAIGEHVVTLETLFPQQERDLAAQEAASMRPDAIEALASITMTSDPFLAEALKAAAARHGLSWNEIVSTGKVTVQSRNDFKPHTGTVAAA